MAEMKLVSVDDMVDKLWGKIGTPERDAMEAQLKEDVECHNATNNDSHIQSLGNLHRNPRFGECEGGVVVDL
jgi:hypothetical protein